MRKLNALLDYFGFVLTHRLGGENMSDPSALPQDIKPDAAKQMLDKTRPDEITVLDVRQDWEYEEFHLPGARHIPLGDLEDRMSEIPRDKPLLVYCHSGRRSAAAASLLAGQGHHGPMNLLGGVIAWKGGTAVGSTGTGMQYYRGDETPEDILALAFAMERELGEFYTSLASSLPDPEIKTLFQKLAGFEDRHKQVVFHLYKTLFPQGGDMDALDAKATAKVPEGGRAAADILSDAKPLDSTHNALDMAMGVEAQALDLYMRYAAVASSVEAMHILHELANEERGHLRALANLMDKIGQK